MTFYYDSIERVILKVFLNGVNQFTKIV